MNIRWTIGAVIAVLSAMFVLPGIATAHEAELSGTASECRDAKGAFNIDWTLTSHAPNYRELDGFDEDYFFEYYFGEGSVDDGVIDVVDGGVAPSLGLDDFTDSDHGQTLDEDGIHGIGSATAQTVYDGSTEPYETIYAKGRVQWSSTNGDTVRYEQNVRSNDVERPDYCKERTCVDGDTVNRPVNEMVNTADCGIVKVCIGGEIKRVTEHDAEERDLQEGRCERTPEITTTSTDPEPEAEEPVEEVEDAVLAVAPVEEVVALPAAGYGSTQGGFAWTALAGLSLIAIGGGLVLVARRS